MDRLAGGSEGLVVEEPQGDRDESSHGDNEKAIDRKYDLIDLRGPPQEFRGRKRVGVPSQIKSARSRNTRANPRVIIICGSAFKGNFLNVREGGCYGCHNFVDFKSISAANC